MTPLNGNATLVATPEWLKVNGDGLPAELKSLKQWVAWEARPGNAGAKPRKVPVDPVNRRNASCDDPNSWNRFVHCWQSYLERFPGLAGIGFQFSADDAYAGIDLDKCRDAATGELHPTAQRVLAAIPSYAEVSPSGTGVKLIVKGKLPEGIKHKAAVDGIEIETYDQGRYFALTGHVVDAEHAEIIEAQQALDAIVQQIQNAHGAKAPSQQAKTPGTGSDDRFRQAMKRAISIKVMEENDGSRRLLKVCCIAVELDLSDSEATRLVGEIHRLAPFPAEFKEAEVMKRLRAAETKTKRGKSLGDQFAQPAGEPCTVTDGRPQIIVTTEEHVATERAVAALGNATEVYQRGGTLVHVVRDDCLPSFLSRPKDSPRIVSLPLPRLREILSREAAWFTYNRKGEMKPSRVDGECVKQAAARGSWPGIRRLEGITEAPMLRPDGSVVTAPGYDRATGLLFVPNLAMPLIKPEPSRDDAQAAAQELLDVVCDFHFASEAHKSGWLASVLTPFARHAFEGCVPLFMIDKNVRGAGGGLLANTIGIITTGRDMAAMPAATDDSEWRKRITSIAVEALPMVLIDNIAGRFGWPSLDAALTSTIWSDRLLKENKNAKARLQTIWYATANNVALQADTARRCLHIRIETDLERPEQRTDFVHADLKAHVRRIRGDLVRAALTILRAYFVAGCPEMQLVEWGSFEQWSRLIRGAITWLGLADPGTTRLELAKQSDVEANAAANLIHAWLRAYASASKSTAEVLHNVHQSEDAEFRELRDALCEFMRCKADDLPTATSFSMKLHHMRQRVIDGCRFESENDSTIDPCAANVRRHNFSSAAWKKERLRG